MAAVELDIERLSKSGEGIATFEGRAVFIEGALPGERVRVSITPQGNVLRGALESIVTPSKARRAPPCPMAGTCGGCDWLHVEEATQLAHKQQIVVSALEHLGSLDPASYELELPHASPAALGYRRRAVLHPTAGKLGFFGKRSHERVAVEHCPALTADLASLPGSLATAIGPAALKELEEVRLLEVAGRTSVSLHAKAHLKPRHREIAATLVRSGVVNGVVLLPQGQGQVEAFGDDVLEEHGVLHRPDGFAQANAAVNEALIGTALDWLQLEPSSDVLELYSGNGNLTFPLARRAGSVTAVESSALSVSLAQRGATKLGLQNIRFMQIDAEKAAAGMVREAQRFDRLLLDPPRAGAPGVGDWASKLLVRRVVYVSCDPGSLARDAAELVKTGFRPTRVKVFDLFPQTHHVETVMLFERG